VTGQVTLSGAAVTLDGSWEASEIACTDSALAWDGTLKARSLRIERAASVVGGAAEETSDVRIISPNEVSVNATRASSFETVAVSESVVGFRGVTACRRSRFRRSVLVIADQVSAQSLLTNATLESCVVISCSGGAASIKVSPSMNDCLVFGLTFDDVDALDVSGVVFHRRPIESDYLTRAAKVDYQHLGDQGEGLSPGNQPRARVAGSQPRGAALGNQQRPRPTTFHPRANGLGLLIADSRSEIQFRFVKFAGAIARALLSGHLNVEAAVAQLISVVGAASLSPDAAAMALPSSISSTICSQQIQRMRTVLA
jgi:hypothetical protein